MSLRTNTFVVGSDMVSEWNNLIAFLVQWFQQITARVGGKVVLLW